MSPLEEQTALDTNFKIKCLKRRGVYHNKIASFRRLECHCALVQHSRWQLHFFSHLESYNSLVQQSSWQLLKSKLPHEKYCYG